MQNPQHRRRWRTADRLVALLILLQAGCMQPAVHHEISAPAADKTAVSDYLDMLYQFSNTDAAHQEALYESVSTRAVLDPSASNRVQLALLKAWPGHPGHNPEAARQMLQTALEQHYELEPAVASLARVYLLIIEQQLQAANHDRMLTSELEEARNKLEALTTIERTVETSPRAEAGP
ncbi:MAG TPA: hypothetical protein VFX02_13235 [Gammaproteobacteria bacterium]|nr:hypothetical protein [Gammaproteobacteria bacterium]